MQRVYHRVVHSTRGNGIIPASGINRLTHVGYRHRYPRSPDAAILGAVVDGGSSVIYFFVTLAGMLTACLVCLTVALLVDWREQREGARRQQGGRAHARLARSGRAGHELRAISNREPAS